MISACTKHTAAGLGNAFWDEKKTLFVELEKNKTKKANCFFFFVEFEAKANFGFNNFPAPLSQNIRLFFCRARFLSDSDPVRRMERSKIKKVTRLLVERKRNRVKLFSLSSPLNYRRERMPFFFLAEKDVASFFLSCFYFSGRNEVSLSFPHLCSSVISNQEIPQQKKRRKCKRKHKIKARKEKRRYLLQYK